MFCTSAQKLTISAIIAATAILFAAPAAASAVSPPEVALPAPQGMTQRLHVLADPASRSVTRRMVTVADAYPAQQLTFTWSPAPGNQPGVDPSTGLAEGFGRLTWRIPGMADFDPRAVHHRFDGSLSAGRPHGPGELRFRDGLVVAGTWVDGLLEGPVILRDPLGNFFEGAFVAGRAEGTGRFVSREGWVYDGPFHDGQAEGLGRITRPGSIAYDVTHARGIKVASTRPHPMPDPLVGGLLPAQGGAMADRTTLALTTDARIVAEQQDMMPYIHESNRTGIQIYPSRREFIDLLNGNLRIDGGWLFNDEMVLWDDTFAPVRVDIATKDGSRVELREVALEVEHSVPDLMPMLRRVEHRGCMGFRPTFHFQNHGWGPVENPRAKVRFVDEDAFWQMLDDGEAGADLSSLPGTDSVPVTLAPFDTGTDVDLRSALQALGVDISSLERPHFDCTAFPDFETYTDNEQELVGPACLGSVREQAGFGQLAPYLWSEQAFYDDGGFDNGSYVLPEGAWTFSARAVGELTFDWTDAAGRTNTVTQAFEVPIQLGVSERRRGMLAELGASVGFPVAAPDFVDAELPVRGSGLRIATRPRGNPNVSSFAGLFRLYSAASSVHLFTAVARFGDGSERRSLPATFYYLRPRFEWFTSQATPVDCQMPPLVWWDDVNFYLGAP